MHDPDRIFKVAVSSKVEEKYFQHPNDAYSYARTESVRAHQHVVSNVYVRVMVWERIAQFRDGVKIF